MVDTLIWVWYSNQVKITVLNIKALHNVFQWCKRKQVKYHGKDIFLTKEEESECVNLIYEYCGTCNEEEDCRNALVEKCPYDVIELIKKRRNKEQVFIY